MTERWLLMRPLWKRRGGGGTRLVYGLEVVLQTVPWVHRNPFLNMGCTEGNGRSATA